jgi:light-regulated signal transduction histidine kinase (bacteriophytochrome)
MGKGLSEDTRGKLEILRQGRLEVVEDLFRMTSPPVVAQLLQVEGMRSFINVPLVSAQGLYGALNVAWEDPRTITPEETEIASEVADQVTIAIQQARLLQEAKRQAAELEQRVADRTTELEAANQELVAFSYSVSHDLRAPLRAVDGFAGILREDYSAHLDQEGHRVLDTICSEARRMGQLIDDLLAFSRTNRQALRPSVIDLGQLAQAVFDECRNQARGRKLRFTLHPLPLARGDPPMLRQVLANLIGNAVKFTCSRETAEIEFGGRVENGQNLYYLKDNGVGFEMKYVHKLFGVFQRLHTETEFEGTGVGLAIVQRVIHRHGGRVWGEGKPNEGATFYFALPSDGKEEL